MASESEVCFHCKKLQSILIEKEKEIKKLKLHIQDLSNFLLRKDSNSSGKQGFKDDSRTPIDETNISDNNEPRFYSSDLFFITCDLLDKHIILDSKFVQTEHSGNLNVPEAEDMTENEVNTEASQSEVRNLHDYVYDKNCQMYYSLSTGYYYDEKSGLMYEPQSGTYYRYNYDTKEYENASVGGDESNIISEDKTTGYMCESVVNQVNNLNLNDETNKSELFESEVVEKVDSEICQSSENEDKNENCDMVNREHFESDNVSLGCAKDWQPTEGSKLTVTDMVRQVVDEHNNMSDYIYDDSYQMYYSPSTGYFYDDVRKLLYDPTTGTYYFYDAEKQTYEFYYQIDSNAVDKVQSTEISVDKEKLTCRKRYWKKKLEHSKTNQKLKSNEDEEKENNLEGADEDKNSEDPDEEFSSLEDGEILSSDSESEFPVSIVRSPVKGTSLKQKDSEEFYPPSIRAIVENSENLQIGSLILITCYGGIVGRDKANAVYVPDVCVSKGHAEIKYDSCLQTYSITDLGSQNGTFINDKRLSEPKIKSEPYALSHGDKLSLGSFKLLLHIHEGYETCDNCEPGQVLAEISSKTEKTVAYMSKEEKEKARREELSRLKKKYGLKGADFERKATLEVNSKGYEDKAEIRRQTVGSDNPYEKTVEASADIFMSQANKGYQMLKKMGWKEGETLGATDSGLVEPIPLRPWTTKAGLGSSGESSMAPLENKKTKRWVKAQERYFQLSLGKDSPPHLPEEGRNGKKKANGLFFTTKDEAGKKSP